MNVRAGLSFLGYCVLHTVRISLFSLPSFLLVDSSTGSHLSKLNLSSSPVCNETTGTVDMIPRFKHSFTGLHFHQLTVFLLDMCMLVELTSVVGISPLNALNSGESIEFCVVRYTPAVVSFIFSLFARFAPSLHFFSCCFGLKLLLVIKPKNTSANI